MEEKTDDSMMTLKQVADRLSVHIVTISNYRDSGLIPAPIKLPTGTLRWERKVIEDWIAAGCPKNQES